MTDREKAIVMAYTGVAMLAGKKMDVFHKYVEELMDRPVQTYELAYISTEIKKRAKKDFLALCRDDGEGENDNQNRKRR